MILVALVAIPSIAVMLYSGMDARHGAIKDAKRELLKFVDDVASQQQAMAAGAEQLGLALSALPQIQARDSAAVNALLSDVLKKNPQYANIAVSDMSGLVWAAGLPHKEGISIADRDYFKDAVRTGGFLFGGYGPKYDSKEVGDNARVPGEERGQQGDSGNRPEL